MGKRKASWEKWYKVMLWKAYFDRGYGTSSYLKYIIAVVGIANSLITKNIKLILVLSLVYAVFCFIFGWAMYKYGLVAAEQEVGNRINPLAQELRKAMNGETFK